MSDSITRHIALIGLSGTGKSTVAPILAQKLGIDLWVDIDRAIESQEGSSVEEIFAGQGEHAFRRVESEVLSSALSDERAVVATGGGIVLDAENRRLLGERCAVVWLRAEPSVLAQRLSGTTETRPLLVGDGQTVLERLLRQRAALYAEAADFEVHVDGLDAVAVADHITRLLQ